MKKRKLTVIAVLATALCLSGCGASSSGSVPASGSYKEETTSGSYSNYASEEAVAETDAENADYAAEAGKAGEPGDAGTSESALRQQDGQKIVYTGRMQMQTLEYEKSAAAIRAKINAAGGFSESESESDNNYDWYRNSGSGSRRYLSITARIPSEKIEEFMDSLGGDGKVMSRSVSAENISQVYANKETYKKALEKEQERLLAMMDKAETIDEMILVEQRLSEVERQLNAYKTDLSAMDKDVQFSTIYIELEEVKRYTEEVVQTPFGEEIKYAFEDAIESFTDFCKGVILFVVRYFPFLIILAAVVVLIIRASAKDRARRIAMMSDPEYAKMMSAKAREKAEAKARKQAAKDAKRGKLFVRKQAGAAQTGAPAGPPEQNGAGQPEAGAAQGQAKPEAEAPAGDSKGGSDKK